MKAALLIVLVLGCHRAEQPPLTKALLAIGAPSGSRRAAAEKSLGEIAARIDARLQAGDVPAHAMTATIFDELGFQREVNLSEPRFMRLTEVLAARRGSCLGLGALFLALGERLGPAHAFTVHGVMVPGHFFVRVGNQNVELLRKGEEMPDLWYVERYEIPDAPEYLRPLTTPEVLAVFDYNIGNDLTVQGRFADAAAAYDRAIAAFPQLAEAHASLGRVRHITGALVEARQAYQAARSVNPHLPGLDNNLAVLEQQIGARD